jgi:hypothetical protein
MTLRPHSRREDVLVSQIQLRPLLSGQATLVSATLGGRHADALVEVKSHREVIEEPIEPPESLEFERSQNRVGWQGKKELVLVAPATTVAENGTTLRVTSSEEGVAIRGTNTPELQFDGDFDFYRAKIPSRQGP